MTSTKPAALMAMIALGAIGLAGCGESAEEKATAQVCSSTKEIQTQLSKLSNLTISSKAPEELQSAATAMQQSAGKIKESAANLPSSAKAPVETAQNTLKTELTALATGVISAAKSGGAEAVLKQSAPEVKAAVAGLATSYKAAYESLKCS